MFSRLDQVFFCGASEERVIQWKQRSTLTQDAARDSTILKFSPLASIPSGSIPSGTILEWRSPRTCVSNHSPTFTSVTTQAILPDQSQVTVQPLSEWIPNGAIASLAPVDITGSIVSGVIRKNSKPGSQIISQMGAVVGDPLKGEILYNPGLLSVTELVKPNVPGLDEMPLEDAIANAWNEKPYFYSIELILNGDKYVVLSGKALFLPTQ